MTPQEQTNYDNALKRVGKIKRFYKHLFVYIVVNVILFIFNTQQLDQGESYFQYKNFATAFFWGIGLLAHAASVFVPTFFLGKDWEERKIKQLLDQDKKETWQ